MEEHFYLQENNMNPNDRQIYLNERERAWPCERTRDKVVKILQEYEDA